MPTERAANLAPRAERDLAALLARSAQMYAGAKAKELEETIMRRCRTIAEGVDLGHVRRDIPTRGAIRFLVVHPFVIAYSANTRLVLRIVDGRRDLLRLVR